MWPSDPGFRRCRRRVVARRPSTLSRARQGQSHESRGMEQFMIRRDPAEVGRECLEMERCGLEIQLGEHGVGEMCRCGQERGILVGPSWLRGSARSWRIGPR